MKTITRDPMYRYLILLTVASTVGLQAWQVMFNNFALESAHLQGNQVGMIQSVREIPGFLALLAVYVMLVIREHRLSALSITLLGAGLAITGLFPSYPGLIVTTLIMSFGFHYYETTNQSLVLQYFDEKKSPWVFGKQRSVAAATSIVSALAVLAMTRYLDYPIVFGIMGGLIAMVGAAGFFKKPERDNLHPQARKMVLRKKYSLYYFLTFMGGARRQIFTAFAILLLVQKFSFSVQDVAILFAVNNGINFFLSPAVGRAIIHFGERKILSIQYASLVVIFTLYAVIDNPLAAGILYVLDHIFFNFEIATRIYFQKISEPGDIAPTTAVGFTINHIAAVLLPALGGALWMIDYRIPFIGGAMLGLISLGATQLIQTGVPRAQEEGGETA